MAKRFDVPRKGGPLVLGQDVLLFFADRDPDTFIRGDRHLRRRLRKTVEPFRRKRQRVSGFEVSFMLLCRALTESGQRVHVDAFDLARRNPNFPIGLCGYHHILTGWRLINPVVLGPGLYDHPKQAPSLFSDPRFQAFITLCDWMREMFSGLYDREKLYPWFGGIDLVDWPDFRAEKKTVDVVVYDKIRWNRESFETALLQPILEDLRRRGLTYEVLRYGYYTHDSYRALLKRARSMIFLCEHETQGMAYQEALSTNVPVLAWDQGTWLDPNRPLWEPEPVSATSVPYFSADCGERFENVQEFSENFDRFWFRLPTYQPRKYVVENLSFAASAEMYMRAYRRAGSDRCESLQKI